MGQSSFYRRWVRPVIPFPRKGTWLRWFPPLHERNIVYLIEQLDIGLVLDVGANEGQFGRLLRRCGYRGRIVSFEPVGSVHAQLAATASGDSLWAVAPALALGAKAGEAKINVHADSEVSSFLPMERMPYADAGAAVTPPQRTESVRVQPLDAVFGSYVTGSDKVLLKIDVQGFEHEVIAGAAESLKKVEAVLIEVSLAPLYTGQRPYLETLGLLRDHGLHAVFFSSVHSRRRHGAEWEYNVFCVRENSPVLMFPSGSKT
jgi:FkbM family methyltransferase